MQNNVITTIYEEIDKCNASQDVSILAVTKNQDAEAIVSVLDAGIRMIGENRVQEAMQKFPLLDGSCSFEKHLIGPLQSNKENNALKTFDVLQSMESLEQLQRIAQKLQQHKLSKKIYLQYNTSQEESKHGIRQDKDFYEMVEFILTKRNVFDFQGLMTIGALSDEERYVRQSFSRLRELRDIVLQEYQLSELKLSMGMSNDYIWAVQEGSNILRIGRKLFK